MNSVKSHGKTQILIQHFVCIIALLFAAGCERSTNKVNSLDMKLIYIPAGDFLMGSPDEE